MNGEERERLLAEALAEYHDRGARGEAVSISEFCRHYPGIAEELAEELEVFASLAETQPQADEPAREGRFGAIEHLDRANRPVVSW